MCVSPRQMKDHCYNCFKKLTNANKPIAFPCCPDLKFCGFQCRDIAEKHCHKILCGKDFFPTYDAALRGIKYAWSQANCNLIWLRVLTICLQHGGHPLDHPLMASLGAQQNSESSWSWSLEGNVTDPIKLLGVDVFANQRYDSWVLYTIWYVRPPFAIVFSFLSQMVIN
jgi:hypothetical protein